jgi:hypothetical protein
MIGRRCEIGCETWPDTDDYEICPVCSRPTRRFRNVSPMNESEARHAHFEAFYEEWDKRPKVRLQMTPEELLRWDSLYPGGKPLAADQPDSSD